MPGVALPLAIGASVFELGALMDGSPPECGFHDGGHLEAAGLSAGPPTPAEGSAEMTPLGGPVR